MIEQIKEELEKTYLITSDGRCINRKRNTEVKFPLTCYGYHKTRLHCASFSKNKDKRIPFYMHRLVAMFYLENFSTELQVNHKNGIKTDNRVENLEMVTAKENVYHAWNILDSIERRKKLGDRRRGVKHTPETIERLRSSPYAKRGKNIELIALKTDN